MNAVLLIVVTLIPLYSTKELQCRQVQDSEWRMIHYSPASVGQSPKRDKIDLYMPYYTSVHQLNMRVLAEMGANTVWISEVTVNSAENISHGEFMSVVSEMNLTSVYSFSAIGVPEANIRNKAREDFNTLVPRLAQGGCVKAIFVPAPGDSDNLIYYYSMVNEFYSIIHFNRHSDLKLIVELPVSTLRGKIIEYQFDTVLCDYWALRFHDKGGVQPLIESYTKIFAEDDTRRLILPIVEVDSFNFYTYSSNEDEQVQRLNSLLTEITTGDYKSYFIGVAVSEFTDEWWRSSLFESGYDVEGCPNTNSYAQTPCGYPYGNNGSILCAEFTGLFRIKPCPFGTCQIPKKSAISLSARWGGTFNSTKAIIALPSVFANLYWVVGVVAFFVISLFLCICNVSCPVKRPTEIPMHRVTTVDGDGRIVHKI